MLDHFHIDTDQKIVFSIYKDILTEADINAEWEKLRTSPDFDPKYWHFVDLTKVTKFGVSVEFMKFLGSSQPLFDVSSRRAFVVASDEAFAMIRLATTYTNGAAGDVHVFRDMAEARRWFDLVDNADEL